MLYDLIPAKEISGGPWYTEQEFDGEFVDELCKFIVTFVRSKGNLIDSTAFLSLQIYQILQNDRDG